jgi:hypothetical protein
MAKHDIDNDNGGTLGNDVIDGNPESKAPPIPEQPKKRGPKGPRATGTAEPKKQTGKKEKLSARQITGMLYMGHAAAASAIGIPQIAIQETEAEQIANALVDVLQFYDFEASAKTVAWANLLGTCAMVYGFKVMAFLNEQKAAQSGDLSGLFSNLG